MEAVDLHKFTEVFKMMGNNLLIALVPWVHITGPIPSSKAIVCQLFILLFIEARKKNGACMHEVSWCTPGYLLSLVTSKAYFLAQGI